MSANSHSTRKGEKARLLQESLAFLHQARQVRDLHPAQVERIRKRMQASDSRPHRAARWPAWAALALVLVAGAGLAVAQVDLRSLPILGSLFGPKPAPTEPSGRAHRSPGTRPPSRRAEPAPVPGPDETAQATPFADPTVPAMQPPAPLPATDGVRPVPMVPAQPTLLPVPAAPRAPSPAELAGAQVRQKPQAPAHGAVANRAADLGPSPVAPPDAAKAADPLVLESRSIAAVIERWHHDHDARAALAALDAHDRRYPSGAMHMETRVLRAELCLAVGRQSEALLVLDGLALAGIPRARELATVRGELRVKAGRCLEARQDLGAVLEKNLTDALAKRAAQALSHCP